MKTIESMGQAIKQIYPMVYCLPIPVISLTGNNYTEYRIIGIGEHETRIGFKTRRLAFTDAYNRIILATPSSTNTNN